MLAVYNENGAMVESYLQSVQTEQSITEIVFSNINLKYASEEYCQFNIFLLDGDQHFVPIAETVHQIIDIQ